MATVTVLVNKEGIFWEWHTRKQQHYDWNWSEGQGMYPSPCNLCCDDSEHRGSVLGRTNEMRGIRSHGYIIPFEWMGPKQIIEGEGRLHLLVIPSALRLDGDVNISQLSRGNCSNVGSHDTHEERRCMLYLENYPSQDNRKEAVRMLRSIQWQSNRFSNEPLPAEPTFARTWIVLSTPLIPLLQSLGQLSAYKVAHSEQALKSGAGPSAGCLPAAAEGRTTGLEGEHRVEPALKRSAAAGCISCTGVYLQKLHIFGFLPSIMVPKVSCSEEESDLVQMDSLILAKLVAELQNESHSGSSGLGGLQDGLQSSGTT
ncbi:hypothetical protein MUK42_15074 [Musa troglodytarum]|uniref:Uncharacterized protein n=1 Tax=Musa troglodytarum TaxID=320322 RepID=A0A9E7KM66_9LILI|nr:hypothetical protein MUK42_15074 [Musa troglodytarum]